MWFDCNWFYNFEKCKHFCVRGIFAQCQNIYFAIFERRLFLHIYEFNNNNNNLFMTYARWVARAHIYLCLFFGRAMWYFSPAFEIVRARWKTKSTVTWLMRVICVKYEFAVIPRNARREIIKAVLNNLSIFNQLPCVMRANTKKGARNNWQ